MLLDRATAALFRVLSRVRRARAFHPRGAAYEASWRPTLDGVLDTREGEGGGRRAIVRTSRAIGLPPRTPDVLGVAIKVLDAHGPGRDQDLLLASVGSGRWSRYLLRPARRFSTTSFSSLFPYEVSGTRTPVVAVVHGEPATSADDAATAPGVRIEVSLERTGSPLGVLILTRSLGAAVERDLRFDPWNTGGSILPVGFLNRVRRPVYEASQRGRSAPPDGARRHLQP